MPRFRFLLFGREARAAGRREVELDWPADTLTGAEARAAIARIEPRLAGLLGDCRLAVNRRFAGDDASIAAADEAAFIGPVSGG